MPTRLRNPKGTRDFYPLDQLRRRYIAETWRAVSLRHGFEEIDGPTFELLDLYTVKSGDEIVSQLFSFQREGGDDTYALRPEFTPTLARMYAEKASTLPKPVRWFCLPSCFRAEKPQRGRLREFGQWNCDVLGSTTDDAAGAEADAELLAVLAAAINDTGLTSDSVQFKLNSRTQFERFLERSGVSSDRYAAVYSLVDRLPKLDDAGAREFANALELPEPIAAIFIERSGEGRSYLDSLRGRPLSAVEQLPGLGTLAERVAAAGISDWCEIDPFIVRGLAYYTGTVFEVIAEGERAVAGGGRYDNLIELFGGPATPACGFGMGDVVLANLLEDKGLMPTDAELPGAVEAVVRSQAVRLEVFVVPGSDDENELITPLVASLRRGVEAEGFGSGGGRPWEADRYTVRPLHARTTDKATRNLKKLLADAEKQRARLAAVVHGEDKVELRNLDTRERHPEDLSVDPASDRYLGRVVANELP